MGYLAGEAGIPGWSTIGLQTSAARSDRVLHPEPDRGTTEQRRVVSAKGAGRLRPPLPRVFVNWAGRLTAGIVISTGPIQALLFTAMAASAAIITSMFVVAVN